MYHTKTVKGGCHIRPVLFCGNISAKMKEALLFLGYTPFCMPEHQRLPKAITSHPDMLACPLPNGKLLLTKDYYEQNQDALSAFSSLFELTDDPLGQSYPDDVKLNALAINDTLFAGKTVSPSLASHYPNVVTVKQGYTHCSACRVGNGIITQDKPLYHALLCEGIDCLLICEGYISLPPYNTGFIGGASITLSPNLTAFFGKIEDHPDYFAIKSFAKAQNTRILSLSDEPLSDFGGGYLVMI